MDFKTKLDYLAAKVNKALDNYLVEKNSPEGTIYKAMKYSIDAGGKRLRPVLALAVCELLGGSEEEVMPFACALEMIHTYSLIHDDLPAMDNDDYRRGRLTNHKVFGEATAILAGDALLNYAFEVMLKSMVGENTGNLKARVKAMEIVAKASGCEGMIGGQVVDMEAEGRMIDAGLLEYMHKCKTGAMIRASVLTPAALSDLSPDLFERLKSYAEKIGLAFQIKDDILDVEGNRELLGKATGSDAANNKSTFVTIYGLKRSREMLEEVTEEAVESLEPFGEKAEFLVHMARYIATRQN